MRQPRIVCHKANHEGHDHPPNTLEAVCACIEAEMGWIEVDIQALRDGEDFLLVHDDTLETETTGSGEVSQCSVEEAQRLRIKDRPDYAVSLLSDLVSTIRDYKQTPCIQLDFKSFYPFPNDKPLHRLAEILRPLMGMVHLSSAADWQLRKIKKIAPWIELGFEIEFYFDLRKPDKDYDPRQPPYREGAYGYHDDSLLSLGKIWPERDYLKDRCTTLINRVRGISSLYVNHRVMARSLEAGFNWAEAANNQGIVLSTWTLDADNPAAVKNLPRLRDAGAFRFTSNTPVAMQKVLNS